MSDLGNKKIMARNIQYYMDVNNKNRAEMCDALGVKYTTFTDWVKGNTYPRIDKIELMANYFGIQKSDLVEDRISNSTKDALVLSENERKNIQKYRTLDEYGKKNVDSVLDNEYARCNESKTIPLKEATDPYKIHTLAAHARPDATEEEKQKDYDMMNDPSIWGDKA